MFAGINWHDPFVYIGLLGVVSVLLGFYRTSIGQWTDKSLLYELDSIIGVSLIVVYQIHVKAYVTLPLNLVWIVVSFRGLIPFAVRRRKTRQQKR